MDLTTPPAIAIVTATTILSATAEKGGGCALGGDSVQEKIKERELINYLEMESRGM